MPWPVVRALDSRSRGSGSSAGRGHYMRFWTRNVILTVSLPVVVFKRVQEVYMH